MVQVGDPEEAPNSRLQIEPAPDLAAIWGGGGDR